jgi:hypothetical protein
MTVTYDGPTETVVPDPIKFGKFKWDAIDDLSKKLGSAFNVAHSIGKMHMSQTFTAFRALKPALEGLKDASLAYTQWVGDVVDDNFDLAFQDLIDNYNAIVDVYNLAIDPVYGLSAIKTIVGNLPTLTQISTLIDTKLSYLNSGVGDLLDILVTLNPVKVKAFAELFGSKVWDRLIVVLSSAYGNYSNITQDLINIVMDMIENMLDRVQPAGGPMPVAIEFLGVRMVGLMAKLRDFGELRGI